MEVALIAGSVSLVTAVLSALVTVFIAEKRVRRDFALDFAAERVARELMLHARWPWRSFRVIKHYLGGFDDDELRRILVRAGAIRHTSPKGVEVWCLLERNRSLTPPTHEPTVHQRGENGDPAPV
jgi:hypothetical protein